MPSGRLAVFQCPDGAPPPCRGARTAPTAPAFSVAVLDPVAPAGDTAASKLADGPQMLITLAQVLIRTGDAERALTLLEDMLARPTVISRTPLRTDPAYAALRGNPRFERLIN